MIGQAEKINVLNYNQNRVSIMASPTENFTFEPSADGITPTVIPMTFEQIRYANNYNAFRGGFLFFDADRAEEVYEALGINNWQDILSNDEIGKILINPSYAGLMKIISIKDSSIFERVRGVFYKLQSEGKNDIAVRVQQIISTRHKELQNNKTATSIVIEKKELPSSVSNEEMDALKAENKAMQEQLAAMQATMEALISKQNAAAGHADDTNPEPETAAPKKLPDRPKKNAD